MLPWQDNVSHSLFRQLAIILALLGIITSGVPLLGEGSLAEAGFLFFKSKRPTPEQLQAEEANRRRDHLRQLQMEHDSATDLVKKIAYDRQIISALDSYIDFEKRRIVENEIQQHEAEIKRREDEIEQRKQAAQQLEKEQKRQQAIRQAKKALEERRYNDAEQAALLAVQILDDAETRQLLTEVRTRRLVEEVKELLARKEIDTANEKLREALQLAPNDPEVQTLRREIDNAQARRKSAWALKMSCSVFLIAGLLVGLYFLLRPRQWVLAGISGACQGQVFPLDLDEVKIGALGPPEGECDIVIYDAQRRISRLHCVIVRNGRHLYLADESTNGTRINNTEVEKENGVKLCKGDQIALTDTAVLRLQQK